MRSRANQAPPLAALVATSGRGGAVALKLLLALIWRSSAAPFATEAPARIWAALLDLENPNTNGARRVKDALERLEELHLISLGRRRGEPSIVTLRREDGGGLEYSLPSTAYTLSAKGDHTHHYFKVPVQLWETGHIQEMSAAALAMLLATLAEARQRTQPVWWSTEEFPRRYGLSTSMRTRGTRELEERGLLTVSKQLLPDTPDRPFGRHRVRNLYLPFNEAATALPEQPSDTSAEGRDLLAEATTSTSKETRLLRPRKGSAR